ncbi:hypothetical protein E1301_Tti020989 [Triplophysa tibetana]|uniref:BCD1 alpha/beta domain-containing protein n=1 Tax=Triplophysa tibetana TaxID=1572043 RepID=A0A5A9NBT4_9TELE|nr:hypothetical protein E1301_Tti020989 [Triplophysa tibetana]
MISVMNDNDTSEDERRVVKRKMSMSRFLEDTGRLTQRSDRDAVLHASRRYPREGAWLIRRARAAKVTLKMLPKLFSRHRENTTIFRKGFSANREVRQILHDFIHPSESDPVRRQKLKVYVQSPQEDIKIFMKSEETQPNSLRYLELDPQKTLGANLMHTTVVEYPEIFVVLKLHSQEYVTRMKEHFNAASENVSRKSEEPLSSASSHVPKKAKIISEADELEDGEIRSDDDESDGDDDVTEKTPPKSHQDDGDTSRRIAPGDVGGQTETLSSLNMDIRNDENIDLHDRQEVKTQTCTVQHEGISCAHASVCGSEAQGNMHRSLDGANANINAADGHICVDVVHSKDASVDSVDVHSANDSDRNIARDIQGSNQADVCEGAENANVYASNSCTPEDTHVETSSQAIGENANICASKTCIAADIQVKGLSQVNVEHANVYTSEGYIARGNQVEGACQLNAEDANVYASDSSTLEDSHVDESSLANIQNANICASDGFARDMQVEGVTQMNIEYANIYASNSCTPEDTHVESPSQANGENANIFASHGCIARDMQVESVTQSNEDTVNVNVYASEGHIVADIPSEGSDQVNTGDSVSYGHVSYQTVCGTEHRV